MNNAYGTIISELPKNFTHPNQWPEYPPHIGIPSSVKGELVGLRPVGARWGVWPVYFEKYISDDEPDMELSRAQSEGRFRVVMWNRISRTDIPPSWTSFSHTPFRTEGFAHLDQSKPYYETWSESTRRYRRHWLHNNLGRTHHIEAIAFEEYVGAYLASSVGKKLKNLFLTGVARRLETKNKECIEIVGVRDVHTNAIIAGIIMAHSPSSKASFYVCGFICDTTVPAMVGLMEYWFSRAQDKGFLFLHFGEFWQPGKPKDWKGFSLFKSKFGLHYISFPSTLYRLDRGGTSRI